MVKVYILARSYFLTEYHIQGLSQSGIFFFKTTSFILSFMLVFYNPSPTIVLSSLNTISTLYAVIVSVCLFLTLSLDFVLKVSATH